MTPDAITNDLKALHVAFLRRDRAAMRGAARRLADDLADLSQAMPARVTLPSPMPAPKQEPMQ